MLQNRPFENMLAARLAEFWAERTPWQRRLWNLGTAAAVSELVEAADGLTPRALESLKVEVARLIGPDPAIGDKPTRQTLSRVTQGDVTYKSVGWHELRQMLERIEPNYVARWAGLVRQQHPPGIERVARSVAGHLLHGGFSATYLHRWLTYQLRGRADFLSAGDLLDEAESDLARRPTASFKVIVPVSARPPAMTSKPPAEWISAAEIAQRVEAIQGSRTTLRQNGGFLLDLEARDHFAAVNGARVLIERWNGRAELSLGKRIDTANVVWVEGIPEPIPFDLARRPVEVGALHRENQIYAALGRDEIAVRIDDAWQLALPLTAGPMPGAISGGWAAIEALLTGTEARNVAAHRLASIVACSYPRAELTTLSYVHTRQGTDRLATDLRVETENLKRARMTADAISQGVPISCRGPQDDAAIVRMHEVLNRPAETLGTVREYVEIAFNRLYRQRNLLLHGGKVSGEGRTETLLTVPALVGAGLDRIAHAWYGAEHTLPFQLAARADLNLALVGSAAGRHATELLES